MKSVIKIKIPYNKSLIETMRQYSYSANKVINFGWNIQTNNKRELHDLTYYKIRKETQLPAQLVCSSRDKAVEVLKSKPKTKPILKERLTIRYDARSFSFKCNKEGYYITLSTIDGRIKIPIEIPEYYWKYLDWKVCSADLIMIKKRLFLHICLSKDIITPKFLDGFLGVDVGINNVAVTSNKQFFNSKQVKRKKLMFKRLRAKLQSKGTLSSKRLLKKISGRENRWMTWVNHNISKEIINCREGTIVLENIKGIRTNKGRRLNYWLHSWSFYQLQRFIEYKGIMNGKRIIKINPYHTSKSCSRCGKIGSRSKSFFVCSHCGYSLNADLNGAINIASKHHSMSDDVSATVTLPHIKAYEHKGTSRAIACEVIDKSPRL